MLKHMKKREVIQDSQHGFTMGKSCLINLVTFHHGVTTSVDKGRAMDVICLDFCKAFDMVPHNILLSKLERYGFNGWTVWWMTNSLGGHIQKVVVNSSMSRWRSVTSSVPRGFVLGPGLFEIFINDTDSGIKCTLSKFVDDIKLRAAVDTPERWNAIQRDLNRPEKWAHVNLMRCNLKLKEMLIGKFVPNCQDLLNLKPSMILVTVSAGMELTFWLAIGVVLCFGFAMRKRSRTKYKVLHLENHNPGVQHKLGSTQLGSSSVERDLGVLMGNKLNVSERCAAVVAKKANRMLGCINKGITSRDKVIIPPYSALVRPHLEYCARF
ncbi:rna-directed dna polymerase from mobile element jockey-like [Limosa lapponica baueri]|uniref:Rna-directed dna polymerase from mobile element jockey-like n=1 Tax=Limosa lapponica baueri TaxID=1758121 RepID=A0A2I0U329_LIMLA|nr:rna-directed dna polymerase from mobile element jockey-like [Limosa lapponica baueri]